MSKEDDDPPEGAEKVGYCRPPRATRFRPGQSGNPRGRPRKPKPIQELLATELRQRAPVRENGLEQKLPKLELVVKRLVHDAIQGNYPAVRLLIDLIKVTEEGSDQGLVERTIEELNAEDREILARYLRPGDAAAESGTDDGA
jgi:hypothetical protein